MEQGGYGWYPYQQTGGSRERAALRERRFSEAELAELHAMLVRGQRLRKRNFALAAGLYMVIAIVLWAMTVAVGGLASAILFAGLALLGIGAVVFAVVWQLAIGIYARQFNDAVDEAYPELLAALPPGSVRLSHQVS